MSVPLRLLRFLTVMAMLVGVGVLTAGTAHAVTKTGRALDQLNIRSGPGTSHKVVGTIAKNATVSYTCYRKGTNVAGPYGSSAYWLRLSGSAERFVAEAWVYTGTNTILVPACGAAPKPAPAPSTNLSAFVKKYSGSFVHDGRGQLAGECVSLVKRYHLEVNRGAYFIIPNGRAEGLYTQFDQIPQLRTRYTRISAAKVGTIQPGDIVVWKARGGADRWGHAAIATLATKTNNRWGTVRSFHQWNGSGSLRAQKAAVLDFKIRSNGGFLGVLRRK